MLRVVELPMLPRFPYPKQRDWWDPWWGILNWQPCSLWEIVYHPCFEFCSRWILHFPNQWGRKIINYIKSINPRVPSLWNSKHVLSNLWWSISLPIGSSGLQCIENVAILRTPSLLFSPRGLASTAFLYLKPFIMHQFLKMRKKQSCLFLAGRMQKVKPADMRLVFQTKISDTH